MWRAIIAALYFGAQILKQLVVSKPCISITFIEQDIFLK